MSKQEIWELFYGADTAIRGRNILTDCFGCCVDYWLCYFYYLPGNTPEYGIFR